MTIVRNAIAALVAGALCLSAMPAPAAERSDALPRLDPLLKTWLRKELGPPDATAEQAFPTRAVSAIIPLSATKNQVMVYVAGSTLCGTGGCPFYILEFDGKTYHTIGKVMGQLPIRLIAGPYGQHPDLTITVGGGGVTQAYATKLHFAGGHYPMGGGIFAGPALKNPKTGFLMLTDTDHAEPVYR